MLPRLATFCSSMSSMAATSVLIGIRQQRQETRALDRRSQLALIEALGAGDTARHDLTGLGHVVLQRRQILVVDHDDAVGGEATEFLAPCKARDSWFGHYAPIAVGSSSISSSRSRRTSPSSSAFAIGEGSVSAVSTLVTRWRSTASLNRKAPISSASVFWSHSMLSRT